MGHKDSPESQPEAKEVFKVNKEQHHGNTGDDFGFSTGR